MSNICIDSFTRANNASSWGTASDGNVWSHAAGAGTVSIASNRGKITGNTGINTMLLGTNTAADFDAKVRFSVSATGDIASITFRSDSGAQNAYRCRYTGTNLGFTKIVSGTTTTVGGGAVVSVTAGSNYWLHVQASGTTLKARLWADGSAEPTSWTLNVTDSTITAAGLIGVHGQCSVGTDTVQFDTFSAVTLLNLLDLASRARVSSPTQNKDLAARARVQPGGTLHTLDLASRARISSPTTNKDLAARARVRTQATLDLAARVNVQQFVKRLDLAARVIVQNSITTRTKDLAARARVQDIPVVPIYLTATIAGQPVTIKYGSFSWTDQLAGRSTCQFTVEDATGTQHFNFRSRVVVFMGTQAIFTGFVNSSDETNLVPNPNNEIAVTCIDEHWIADKRAYTGNDFVNQYAGNIVTSLANVLANDGIIDSYAIRSDSAVTDFGQGTLSNVVAASNVGATDTGDGDLELAPAGVVFNKLESTTNDFLQGTRQGTTGLYGDYLSLYAINGLTLTGTCWQGAANNYAYVKFWDSGVWVAAGNSAITIASGDTLRYSVWIASTSPEIKAGVDGTCSDGTTLRSVPMVDQSGMSQHPGTDLAGFADDTRYFRQIDLTALAGKTLANLTLALEGDKAGTYAAYFDNIQYFDINGQLKATFYTSALQQNTQIANVGYTNVSLQEESVYVSPGTRLSPVYALTSTGIARSSLISWSQSTPPVGSVNKATNQVMVETSVDGGTTWQVCTNNSAIPNLYAGMNLAGRTLQLRQTLQCGGPDPTETPYLYSCEVTVEPAYAASKNDAYLAEKNPSGGTTNNVALQSGGIGLGLAGIRRTFYNYSDVSGITTFGSATVSGNTTAVSQPFNHQLSIRCDGPGTDGRARLDFAGTQSDFICEVDVFLADATSNYGIEYRTNNWVQQLNSYAYNAFINGTTVQLYRGSNGIGGGAVALQSVSITFATGQAYHLKVVAVGSLHKVYVDDVLYITQTDANFASGNIALRYYNNTGARNNGYFKNVGIMNASSGFTGFRTGDLLSLVGVADTFAVDNSLIAWNADVPSNTALVVESSIDGGTNWQICTNNKPLPQFTSTSSSATSSVRIRTTFTTYNANATPVLYGLNVVVMGHYVASGYRIAPALSLSSVGRAGDSLISWNALTPANTTLGVDVSLDGVTWTDVSASNGGEIPFINGQDDASSENYDVDTSANYTSIAMAGDNTSPGITTVSYVPRAFGGTLASTSVWGPAKWQIQTQNSLLIGSGGAFGALLYNGITTFADGELSYDSDYSEHGGMVWNVTTDGQNGYELSVHDSGTSSLPNTASLFKTTNGVRQSLLINQAISFPRGVPTRIRMVQVRGLMIVYVDGQEAMRYNDSAPLPAGYVGLRSNGGTNRYYQFRMQPYGDDVSGLILYSRTRLSTTDPTVSPQVEDITLAVHSPDIHNGALIPKTAYSVLNGSTNTIAQDLDDLAKQSTYWWQIKNRVLQFLPHDGIPAPWIATGRDMLLRTKVHVKAASDLYRNDQWVIGGTDLESRQDIRFGDGQRTSFDTSEPIDALTSITVGDQSATFGIKGVDTGKDWYYQKGQKGVIQDTNAVPLPKDEQITINSLGQVPVVVHVWNQSQIDQLAAQDNTSGIVTIAENAPGLNKDAATTLAQSRLQQYGVLSQDIEFTTNRPGLAVGQFLTAFLAQHALYDDEFLITDVTTDFEIIFTHGQPNLLGNYAIKATNGPDLGNWLHLFS